MKLRGFEFRLPKPPFTHLSRRVIEQENTQNKTRRENPLGSFFFFFSSLHQLTFFLIFFFFSPPPPLEMTLPDARTPPHTHPPHLLTSPVIIFRTRQIAVKEPISIYNRLLRDHYGTIRPAESPPPPPPLHGLIVPVRAAASL